MRTTGTRVVGAGAATRPGRSGAEVPSLLEPRRQRPPIVRWALVGAFFLAVEIFVITTWFTSGEATPTSTGADPVPGYIKGWAIALQIVCPLIFVAALVYVVRQCRRERRLTFDAVLLIAWCLVYWQDPMLNYLRPIFSYNSYLVNLGSWTSRTPGWMSPRGHLMPEPLVLGGTVYGWFLFASMMTCAAMRWAKRRWPHLGSTGLVTVGFASMILFDFVLEVFFVRTHMYIYASVVKELTIFHGTWNQFPIYESFLWGGMMAATGVLRYFRDDRGRSVVERGVDQLEATTTKKNILRILAVSGCLNVMFIFTYNLPIQVFNLHADDPPELPTYLRNDLCGEGTPYRCPGPDTPIYLRGQEGDVRGGGGG
ncbi:MAG: spirocyclase AveC family protein [Acidimicrobiia bacterium]|nr:spirocyclase AveC family protein [Acidimicrobiia bacterium]